MRLTLSFKMSPRLQLFLFAAFVSVTFDHNCFRKTECRVRAFSSSTVTWAYPEVEVTTSYSEFSVKDGEIRECWIWDTPSDRSSERVSPSNRPSEGAFIPGRTPKTWIHFCHLTRELFIGFAAGVISLILLELVRATLVL